MKITFLGTGTSHGIPVIGCECHVCQSTDTRNRRKRTGIWLSQNSGSLLLDVSGDFREGALQHHIHHVDGVLLTHAHSDHVSGLDDLRIYTQRTGKALPLFGNEETFASVKKRFDYAFNPPRGYGGGIPQFEVNIVYAPFQFQGFDITPLPILHGPDAIFGYRIGNFALITDVTVIPDATLAMLSGLEYLALDCLRIEPHSTHLCLEQAVGYAQRIGAKKTFFIHMCHDIEHAEIESQLPESIQLAYDGMELTL